jgi:hypothetical protein
LNIENEKLKEIVLKLLEPDLNLRINANQALNLLRHNLNNFSIYNN